MQNQASRLSASLGVGKIKDKKLAAALFGFVREGVRFAFSIDDPRSDEDLPLGCRLAFLLILSKYLSWIRKDKQLKENLAKYLNEHEAELRSHPDFADVYEADKKALEDFRKTGDLGEYYVEEDTATYTASQKSSLRHPSAFKPRTSLGSSVSSIQGTLGSIDEEGEPEGGSPDGTPSPAKRSVVPSSARTEGSVSTLGTRESPLGHRKKSSRAASEQSKDSESGGDNTSGDEDGEGASPPKRRRRPSQDFSEALPSVRSNGTGESSDDDASPPTRSKSSPASAFSDALPSIHTGKGSVGSGESDDGSSM